MFFANIKSKYQNTYLPQIWPQSLAMRKAQDKNKVAYHRVHSKTSATMETVLKLEQKFFYILMQLDKGSKSGDVRIIPHILNKT